MKYGLENRNIHIWIEEEQIKNEQGIVLDFHDHAFLWDVYQDMSSHLVIFKAAQIGFSTLAVIKSLWICKNRGMDIIYTLPTESDRNEFVSGKVNRIIAQNPCLQEWTKDKDAVEQKKLGNNLIYYRGTWTQKAAIMIPSDLNIYDEVDASKQDVVEQYSTRLQHSKYKWEWYFSHPSATGTGVDKYWGLSDQKHWFIRCRACEKEQYLDWPQSIDMVRKVFICKHCKEELTDDDRRKGRWIAKYADRDFSGYWIPLLICPWVSAKEIINYHKNKTEEYFVNKVLGLPYVGGGNKLTKAHFIQNLTDENLYPDDPLNDRLVLGGDTGTQLYTVIGGEKGLFYYGTAKNYDEWDKYMRRWPRMIAVVDQGGDLIGSRAFRDRWPGRVFLCTFKETGDSDNAVWGDKDEHGMVKANRNKFIQLVVDEFTDKRIPVMGNEADWYDYYVHWNNLTRIKEIDQRTGVERRKIWVKSGQSDFSFATVYWRIGMSRFSNTGAVMNPKARNTIRSSPTILPGKKMEQIKPLIFAEKQNNDWRL